MPGIFSFLHIISILFITSISSNSSALDIDAMVIKLEKKSGCNLLVTSGYRSPKENKRVGGAKNSYHLKDQARDIVPVNSKCISVKKLGNLACKYVSTILYKRHVHIDARKNKICIKGTYKKRKGNLETGVDI